MLTEQKQTLAYTRKLKRCRLGAADAVSSHVALTSLAELRLEEDLPDFLNRCFLCFCLSPHDRGGKFL